MSLPTEVWSLVVKNVRLVDSFAIRLIETTANRAFQEHVDGNGVFPLRTFIRADTCMHCRGVADVHIFSYIWDFHPRRWLYSCDRFECFAACLGRYLQDMKQDKVNIFCRATQNDKWIWVPRTSGRVSQGRIAQPFVSFNDAGDPCVIVDMSDVEYEGAAVFDDAHIMNRCKKVEVSCLKSCKVTIAPMFTSYL